MSEPKIRLGQVTSLETQLNTIYTQANNAYSTANTATTTGGGGYDQANNAYAQANSAYSQANLSYSQANSAYNQSNSAYTQANSAYGQANSAYGQANSSYTQANAGYTQANSAYSQANSAYGQANSAYGQANSSYTQANSAYGQANSGYSAANTAQTTAQDAYGQANTATTNAGNAYGQANNAYTQANAGYTQANSAYSQANNAYSQANSAYGQANSSYTQANAAYLQANTAYLAANNSNLKLGGVVSGTLNITQDIIVGGNIYLEGNTTFINVATYSVEDSLIYLASNNSLTDSVDIGFMGGKNTSGTYSHTGFARDATDGKWKLFDGLAEEGHVGNVVDFANTKLATLVANVEANTLTVVNGISGNVNFDSGTLFVDSVNDKVGIGTTSPLQKLHVNGPRAIIDDGSGTNIGLSIGTTSTSTGSFFGAIDVNGSSYSGLYTRTGDVIRGKFVQLSTSRLEIGTVGDIPVQLHANDAPVATITTIGVGIGTTSPTAKLTVKGDIDFQATNSTNKWAVYTYTDNTFRWNYNGAGADELTMDSSGNLGIGTTSPSTKLHVRLPTTTSDVVQRWESPSYDSVDLYVGSTQAYFGTVSTTPLTFRTNNTERMRFTGDGNAIIGTSVNHPSSKLFVAGPITTDWSSTISLRYNVSGQTTNYFKGMTGTSIETALARGLHIFNYDADSNEGIAFYPNNYAGQIANPAMKITSGGNVGIGTTSPRGKLDVLGYDSEFYLGHPTSDQVAIMGLSRRLNYGDVLLAKNLQGVVGADTYKTYATSAASGYAAIELKYAGDVAIYGVNGATTANATVTPTARLYIQGSSGNVGINTTSPGYKLDVNGTSIFRDTLNFGSGALISWTSGYSDGTTQTFNSPSGGSLAFVSNSSLAMFIKSNQNVGIGTTNPTYKLQVTATGGVYNASVTNAANVGGGVAIVSDSSGTNSRVGLFLQGSDRIGAAIASAREDTGATWKTYLAFYTNNLTGGNVQDLQEKMRLNSDGNVGIGTTNPGQRLHIVDSAGPVIRMVRTSNRFDIEADNNALGFVSRDSGTASAYFSGFSGLTIGATTSTAGAKFAVRGTTDLGDSQESSLSSLHATRLSGYALRYDASNRYGNYGVLIFNASHGWTSSAKRFMLTNGINANKFCIIRSVDGLTDPTLGDAGSITSGTADFTIDSSGNIGIGESTPSFKLDVKGAGGSNGEAYRNVLIFDTNTAAAGVGGGIAFGGYYSGTSSAINDFAGIQGLKENGTAGDYAGALKFTTRTNGNTPVERMRISSDGKVGIGTTSPSAFLHISSSLISNNDIVFEAASGKAYGAIARLPLTFIVGSAAGAYPNAGYNVRPCANGEFQRVVGDTSWYINYGNQDRMTFHYISSGSSGVNVSPSTLGYWTTSGFVISGSLSKGSGSFRIDHPLPEKSNTHDLVHSFIEGPQADLIYRGKVNLVNGAATVNIDTAAGMTEGTFVLLCRDVQCFTSNETDWDNVRGSVSGNILTIECQNPASNATISWMVIGERQDKHMIDTEWTDENGKVIVEPEKIIASANYSANT